jgi:hypothetical protein
MTQSGLWRAITSGPPKVHDLVCSPICYFGKVVITDGFIE